MGMGSLHRLPADVTFLNKKERGKNLEGKEKKEGSGRGALLSVGYPWERNGCELVYIITCVYYSGDCEKRCLGSGSQHLQTSPYLAYFVCCLRATARQTHSADEFSNC